MPSNPTPDEMRLALAQQNRVAVPNRPGRTMPADQAKLSYAFTHGLAPMLYGAAKGTAASVPGLVGDVNELLRDYVTPRLPAGVQDVLRKAPAPFTTEQYVNMMPKMGGHTENMATKLGSNVVGTIVDPFAVVGAVKRAPAVARSLAETANNKILQGESLIPGVPAQFVNPPVLSAVKPKGGNWLTQPTDWTIDKLMKKDALDPKIVEELGLDAAENNNKIALNNWVDKKVKPYVRNELGTPDDPIRQLGEKGVSHLPVRNMPEWNSVPSVDMQKTRSALGYPPMGVGTTREAKTWETLADEMIGRGTASNVIENFDPDLAKKDPWLSKVDPDTTVHWPKAEKFQTLGFDHIMDVLGEQLARGEISAADLSKISMKDAVTRTHKYDEALAEAKRVKSLQDQANMTKVKEYSTGDKWVQLDKPGQFAAESDAMGHSVRGYEPHKSDSDWIKESGTSGYEGYGLGGWNAIKEGRANVFSLRNPKGESQATIEARKNIDTDYKPERLPKDISEEFRLASEKEAVEAGYRPGTEPFFNYVTGGEIQKRSKWFRENPQETFEITQIKGPKNGEVDPDHAYHVLDFLNSRPIGEVNSRDLENVYITDMKNKRQLRDFVNENYGGNMGMVDANQVLEHLELNYPQMPRFVHNMELGNMIDEVPSVRDKPEGYKDGGGVSASNDDPSLQFYSRTMDNPDSSKTTEQGIVKQFEQDYMRFALQRHQAPARSDIPNAQAPAARTNIYGEYGTPALGGMVSGRVTKLGHAPDTYMGDLSYRTPVGPGMAHLGVQGMQSPQMPAKMTGYQAGYNVPLGGNGFAGVNVMQPAQGGKPVLGAQVQYRKSFAKGGAVRSLETNLPKLQKTDYESIDELMTEISKRHKTAPKKLHDDFVEKHRMTPDNWIKRK
jgi:hypothetical protein